MLSFFFDSFVFTHHFFLELYSKAIELNPDNAVLYSNRSACHLIEEAYGFAIEDASTAIKKDPSYAKVCKIIILPLFFDIHLFLGLLQKSMWLYFFMSI